jgi:ABC-type nitrate/sulfonate/bicarbonate transport system substrate-binding protein
MITGGMPMAPSLRLPIRAALAGVLAANFAIAAQAADKVAVGTGGSASDAPFYIAYDKGFFKDEGLDVDLIVLDSGAKVIAPLGTGELDVGSGALSVSGTRSSVGSSFASSPTAGTRSRAISIRPCSCARIWSTAASSRASKTSRACAWASRRKA